MDKDIQPSGSFYVASDEPPPARRPPVTEVGAIKWIRENLFKTWTDGILTLLTLFISAFLIIGFLNWAIFQAQWEIVFLNLRQISVGNLFPQSEIWRIDLIVAIIVGLTFLSIAVWGRIQRGVVITTAFILGTMYILPPLTQSVEEPTVKVWAEVGVDTRYVQFVADAGQTISVAIDPLTQAATEDSDAIGDYSIDSLQGVYIENDNQQGGTSFDSFNERSTAINFLGEIDPTLYDMNIRAVVEQDGQIVGATPFTQGSQQTLEFTWTAQDTGWYVIYAEFHPETPGENGAAWLNLDGLQAFRSTNKGFAELEATYGPRPEQEAIADCSSCVTGVNRTDMRFQGDRTLEQFFSLQLAPFLLETRDLFTQMVILAAIAYLLGRVLVAAKLGAADQLEAIERRLSIVVGGLIMLYFGIQVTLIAINSRALQDASFATFTGVMLCALLYAGVQFFKEDRAKSSRGMTILWLVSIPLIWTILTGFSQPETLANVPENVNQAVEYPLPAIQSDQYGGMALTLLLSAVAIIASFPLGVLLALGRQSDLPVISLLCTIFIEVVRGVPLITLLFFGRFILPFFGFGLGDVDILVRIMVMLTLFTAAYMAEVVRGGLQIVPKGQIEASQALGLNGFWTTVLIVLPQALRAVIPAIMGQAVSLFKDTTLVYIVGLFEILGTMNQILGDSQTGYTLFPREGYLYVAIAYFVFAYLMADISRRLERTGAGSIRKVT
jgi:His/Glu/Gln/Arg/opine family amino acid ABC transporter permease subunit